MKIACNYYLETQQLLDEGRIDLDYFKFPALGFQMEMMRDLDAFESFCGSVVSRRPILLHGLYPVPHDFASTTLRGDFRPADARRLIRMTGTPGLSFHPSLDAIPVDVPFEQTLETVTGNARFMREQFGDMAFVSIENCDSMDWGGLVLPETLTRLLDESGCSFLLDISHAYCVARLMGVPFYDYLGRLPLDRTTEIHINGWIDTGSDVMCHTKIHREGYRALEFVLERCQPQIITVEYGRHNDRIGAGVPVMSPDRIHPQAKDELEEQILTIQELCLQKGI